MSGKIHLKSALLAVLVFLFSCDQDSNDILIQGIISDPDQAGVVEGAEVVLKVIEMQNGTWGQNYTTKASTISENDGSYSFKIPFFYTIAYKLEISKDRYFHESIQLEENEFDNNSCTKNIEIHPKATLKIHLRNNFPFNNQDKVRYRILDWEAPYDDCCPSTYTEFTGMNIDEIVECLVIGNQSYTIEYTYTRNNNSNVGLIDLFCKPFETNLAEINF